MTKHVNEVEKKSTTNSEVKVRTLVLKKAPCKNM